MTGGFSRVPENVYVTLGEEYLLCLGCSFVADYPTRTTAEMVEHLGDHEAVGDLVPPTTYAWLEANKEQHDARLASVSEHPIAASWRQELREVMEIRRAEREGKPFPRRVVP